MNVVCPVCTVRPSALTTPVVRVLWKPKGLPIASARWPTCNALESPSGNTVSFRLGGSIRSEEHTSELQSLAYLVCRLLLEKKKKKRYNLDARASKHATATHLA